MTDKLLRFFIAVFFLVSSSCLYAQSSKSTETQMNEIKLNENMIYGESSDENKNIAYSNALFDLLEYANKLRAKKGNDLIKVSDLQTVVKELAYLDLEKNRHTVLVYIPLLQLFSITSKSHADIIQQSSNNQSSQNCISETERDSITDSEPNFTLVPNNSNYNGTSIPENIYNTAPLPNEILNTLCGQDNWTEIKGFLTAYKKQGKIKETGFTTSHTEVPVDAYSILIDEMYGILAILSPKNTANRINYRTNRPDSETNHSNYKVIVWYR